MLFYYVYFTGNVPNIAYLHLIRPKPDRLLDAGYQGVSGDAGRIRFAVVRPGDDYRLSVLPRADFASYTRPGLALDVLDATIDVVLSPLATGRVEGRAITPEGEPVPHFALWLQSDMAQGRFVEVVTDGEGYFEADAVPEGLLQFATRSEPMFRTHDFDLLPGESLAVEVVHDQGSQALRGQVLDGAGAPMSGVALSLLWRAGEADDVVHSALRPTITDAAGAFGFTGLGGGPYELRAYGPGSGHDPGRSRVRPELGGTPPRLTCCFGTAPRAFTPLPPPHRRRRRRGWRGRLPGRR